MKKVIISLQFMVLFIAGCAFMNECGYSSRSYNDGVEFYDSAGNYHKNYPNNDVSNDCDGGSEIAIEDCINCN